MYKLISWESLPKEMKNDNVNNYYILLQKRSISIAVKRGFDLIVGIITSLFLIIPMVIIAIMIKIDSEGPILFKQNRVSAGNRIFKIYKFRTMIVNAEYVGAQVTSKSDSRITRVGKMLRKARLDELPQIFNVIKGDMSFVGTRPEVPHYVDSYTDEMYATLLLPAGITSETSIKYKDEERLINNSDNSDETYINEVLPQKMKYNLEYLKKFSFWYDIKIMFITVLAVIRKDDKINNQKERTKKEKEYAVNK